jgi:hypothetical protein
LIYVHSKTFMLAISTFIDCSEPGRAPTLPLS